MSDLPVAKEKTEVPSSLAGLIVPLADRNLLLPSVAVAELIPYRAPQSHAGLPSWCLGQIAWRDLRLPLLSFEAAGGGQVHIGSTARVIVLNALGGRPKVKFFALLVQGIPRSVKLTNELRHANLPLAPLELDAAYIGEEQARIPDLLALEQLLADSGLIEP